MKKLLLFTLGAVGSLITDLLGGWNGAMSTLLTFMIIDYLTGLAVAGIFSKSAKTETGKLNSAVGFKGICKKCMIFVFVIIGHQLDILMQIDYVQNLVIISFIANELLSIVENAGLMGVPVPAVISKAIDLLNRKESDNDGNSK